MAVSTLSSFPNKFTAGDTLSVTLSLSDYKASDGWTGNATFIPDDYANHTTTTIESVASGDNHVFTLAKADSANLQPGEYKIVIYAESSTERMTVETVYASVLPNPATTDRKQSDWAVRVLGNLEDAYEKLTEGGLKTTSVSINGKSYTRTSLIELREEIAHWRNRVNQLRRMEGNHNPWQGYQVRM